MFAVVLEPIKRHKSPTADQKTGANLWHKVSHELHFSIRRQKLIPEKNGFVYDLYEIYDKSLVKNN